MARPLPNDALSAIETALAEYPDGASVAQVEAALAAPRVRRTRQYHLRALVKAGRLRTSGERRGVRYYLVGNSLAPVVGDAGSSAVAVVEAIIPLSPEGEALIAYVNQPVALRKPVATTTAS